MNLLYNVSVDFSLSSPAICIIPYGVELSFSECRFHNIQSTLKYCCCTNALEIERMLKNNKFINREQRFQYLLKWFQQALPHAIKNFFIEGYSLGSVGQVSSICEVGGLIRNHIHTEYKISVQEFPPTTIKKVFAGAGDAKKDEMIDTFVQRTKTDLSKIIGKDIDYYAPLITDLVDSYAVMYTGLNQHLIEQPKPKKRKKNK